MILCDNIIFELQRVGGVSKYWAETIARLDSAYEGFEFLEGPGSAANVFRRGLSLKSAIINETGPATMRRFFGPKTKSDVFHSSYYRISRHTRANVVTIHDFMNELFPSSFRDPLLARLKKRACRNADAIVVVSKRTKKDLLHFYPFVDPGRVRVTYNGVGDEYYPEFMSDGFDVNETHLGSRGYFLYVGTRGHCKNFPFVLRFLAEAWRQGLRLPLVIVGGGKLTPSEYANSAELGLPHSAFIWYEGLPNSQLRLLYSNCLALLIPSIYEGFGLPAAEAARCGALVLSARGSALDEIVGPTEFSFDLSKTDEPTRILSLGLDNAKADEERERTRHRSKMFDWETSSTRLKEIYDEL